MQPRSNSGITKPKAYNETSHPVPESLLPKIPSSMKQALADSRWYASMQTENEALIRNKTWSLVPYHPSMTLAGNK